MIAIKPVLSTAPPRCRSFGTLALAVFLALGGCAYQQPLTHAPDTPPAGVFVTEDGARLPYRVWLPPDSAPKAVILALHGMNDSRDAWEIPAPAFADAGIAVIAPDQRGFGQSPGRGLWPGTGALVQDAGAMARAVHKLLPNTPEYLMGESMGAAVLMCLATSPEAPPVAGYILVAPAVWGRAEMDFFLRAALYVAANVAPGVTVGRPPG